jgi:hypothetical protein
MPKQYYRIIVILLMVVCGVGAVVAAPIALLTAATAFNAQSNQFLAWVWIVFFLSVPLWFIIGAIAGWVLYLHNRLRTSLLAVATPLVVVTVGWLLLFSV